MDLERLKRIRISSPRREERVKFLSDSESEISLNEDDLLNTHTGKTMTETEIVHYRLDPDDFDIGPEGKQQTSDELVRERRHDKSTTEAKTDNLGKYGFKDLIKTGKVSNETNTESKNVNKQEKKLKTSKNGKSDKKKHQNDLFVEDIITPVMSPRPSSAIRRNKNEQNQEQRITLPVFPKVSLDIYFLLFTYPI